MEKCPDNDGKHLSEKEYRALCDFLDDHISESFHSGILKYADIQICYHQFISVIFTVLIRHVLESCDKASEHSGIPRNVILVDVVKKLIESAGLSMVEVPFPPTSSTVN